MAYYNREFWCRTCNAYTEHSEAYLLPPAAPVITRFCLRCRKAQQWSVTFDDIIKEKGMRMPSRVQIWSQHCLQMQEGNFVKRVEKPVEKITENLPAIPDDDGAYNSEKDMSPELMKWRKKFEKDIKEIEARYYSKESWNDDDDDGRVRDEEAYNMRMIQEGDGDMLGY